MENMKFREENEIERSVEELCKSYGEICQYRILARTHLHRGVPIIKIGKGKKPVLYLGSQSGKDSLSWRVLLLFAREICQKAEADESVNRYRISYMLQNRVIFIIPCLNLDGYYNQTNENARNVDLAFNYNSEKLKSGNQIYPESESEVAALCNLIRFCEIDSILEIAEGDKCFSLWKTDSRSRLSEYINHLTGYEMQKEKDFSGTLLSWVYEERQKNALKIQVEGSAYSSYNEIRTLLFSFPFLQ